MPIMHLLITLLCILLIDVVACSNATTLASTNSAILHHHNRRAATSAKQHLHGIALTDVHTATGVSILQSQQLHGSGIKIGIVDSGIDYEHPALGGCFGKGCCVAHGHDLVGDAYDGKNKPVPSERPPRDCMGHGTQVAGIIAADSPSIQGVAPAAILGAYRVIGCTGVTSGHLLRKAIVLAAKEGMDIISLSVGRRVLAPKQMLVDVVERASHLGVIVVGSVGANDGSTMWYAETPAITPQVMSIGMAKVVPDYSAWFVARHRSPIRVPYTTPCIAMQHRLGLHGAALRTAAMETRHACRFDGDVRGKVVVLLQYDCALPLLLSTARDAGAIGVVATEPYQQARDMHCRLPLFTISAAYAQVMRHLLTTDAALQLDFQHDAGEIYPLAKFQASTSVNWGPTPQLRLSPHLLAPGHHVITTNVSSVSELTTATGTSFSTPYVAGSIALFLEARQLRRTSKERAGHGDYRDYPAIVHAAFLNTATPLLEAGPFAASVASQGAGAVNCFRAVHERTSVVPPVIELGDYYSARLPGRVKTFALSITNGDSVDKRYHLSHRASKSIRGFDDKHALQFPPEHSAVHATVKFHENNIVVPKHATRSVTVSITEPYRLPYRQNWLYTGYIAVDPSPGPARAVSAQAVHVPYLGLKGDIGTISSLLKQARKQQATPV